MNMKLAKALRRLADTLDKRPPIDIVFAGRSERVGEWITGPDRPTLRIER